MHDQTVVMGVRDQSGRCAKVARRQGGDDAGFGRAPLSAQPGFRTEPPDLPANLTRLPARQPVAGPASTHPSSVGLVTSTVMVYDTTVTG